MRRTGAKIDIKDMLMILSESDVDYRLVNFEGTFSLIDATTGDIQESVVVWATYEADSVAQIDWGQFLHDDIYTIATTSKFHPAW